MVAPVVEVPASLRHVIKEAGDAGEQWLDRLPELVAEAERRFGVRVGRAWPVRISFVAPAIRDDGTAAVLKLTLPEAESAGEAEALRRWDGDGAVRLLDSAPDLSAMLLERLEPGTTLWELPEEEANPLAVAILPRLWKPVPEPHPFPILRVEAARWAEEIPRLWEKRGRPYERSLAEEGAALAAELAASVDEDVLLHQDFHNGNVLAAEREPWLVIDPKPIVGDRAFDTASLVRDRRDELATDPHPARRIRRRVDFVCGELGLDRARVRGWGVVHALFWGSSDLMYACARWIAAVRA
jgi:streptomycin 6-kinase